jgi:tetratricopeptide (TPR) repeat protein
MSLLTDLLKSLTPGELTSLDVLDIQAREKEVLQKTVHSINKKGATDLQLQQGLKLSKSHFDKINSKLLDKVIIKLAGTGLSEKFYYLLSKQMFDLILHQVKLAEKRIKKDGNKDELKDFYLLCFQVIIRFNYNNFPTKALEQYANAHIQLLTPAEDEMKYKLLAVMYEQIIRYNKYRQKSDKVQQVTFNKLLQIEKVLSGKKWHSAEMRLHCAFAAYHEMVDAAKSLEQINKAERAANEIYNQLEDKEKAFIILMKASLLMDNGKFDESVKYYERAQLELPKIFNITLYHTYNFSFALLINGDYEKAYCAMNLYFTPFLENEHAKNYHFDILRLYVIYALLVNDLNFAEKYVQQLQQFSKNDFTLFGDGIWRFVHTVYIAQTGDYLLATEMVRKNLKFAYEKIEIVGFTILRDLLLALGNLIRLKQNLSSNKNAVTIHQLGYISGKTTLYLRLLQNFQSLPAIPLR